MASFEDYDEFGNYIGADIDSDDEPVFLHEEVPAAHASQQQPLEGYDEGPMDAGPGTALMEVDGACYPHQRHTQTLKLIMKSQHTMLSSCTRINSIILPPRRCMVKALRPWCRKRMLSLSRNPLSPPSRYENGL